MFVRADSNQDDIRQRVAFPLAVDPAPDAGGVIWSNLDGRTVQWELPTELVAAIGLRPSFELQEFDAWDVPGDEVAVSVTVANSGAGDGRFLAEAGNERISDQPEIAVGVPSGETVTRSRNVWAEFGDTEEVTVVLGWRDTRLERTVQVS